MTASAVAARHAYALAYWPAVQEARERRPSSCGNPQHDHTTTVGTVRFTIGGVYTGEEITYPEPLPMRCNDCGAPCHWDEGQGWYLHDDPEDGECFLSLPADFLGMGVTPCDPPSSD